MMPATWFRPTFRRSEWWAGRKGICPARPRPFMEFPSDSETSMFAYRKDIFDKYGWKVPKTYDEMLKLCKLVKEKEPGMGGLTMRGEAGHQVQHAWFNHSDPLWRRGL